VINFSSEEFMKKLIFAIMIVSLVFAVSCGSDTKSTKNDNETVTDNETTDENLTDEEVSDNEVNDETVTDEEETEDLEEVDEDTFVPVIACGDFTEGMNQNFIVGEGANELSRDFILRLPSDIDSETAWPVVFLYHGYGDTAQNFQSVLSNKVNNEEMPFILVVPVARADVFTFGLPPKGLDWDMINLTDGSAEADMFDAVLNCIDGKWGVNADHIHVSGFSAGAITANSIALQRPEIVASVFTYSGAYFSDPESRTALGQISGMNVGDFFKWPDMEEIHTKYPQVFVSGGEGKDTWSASGFKIDFNVMANLGSSYLSGLGHDVILCNHGGTHTIAGPTTTTMLNFFKDHPFGTEVSPYRSSLPEGYDTCEFFTEETDDSDDADETDDSDNI
jgi:predicted esterase